MALANKFNTKLNITTKIERNRIKYASEIKKLASAIRKNNKAYHNSGKPLISDNEYDIIKDRLKELDPEHSILKEIGAPVRGAKVALPYPLGSLDKYRNKDFYNIVSLKKGSRIIATDKMDGSSALIQKTNKLKMYSRGNGIYGQDISSMLDSISGIGNLKEGEAIRGELIISKKSFINKFSSNYDNARNLVSGSVNAKEKDKKILSSITFVAHEFIQPSLKAEDGLKRLKSRGFNIPTYKVFDKNVDVSVLDEYVKSRKEKSIFDIDGIVIEFNDGYRCAYKLDEPPAKVKVKEIVWQITKSGILKPVIVFSKPVKLSGASITKATGINAKFIMENGIGPGAIVGVIRSGDVIPKVIIVYKRVKPEFPDNAEWNSTDTDAVLLESKSSAPLKKKQAAIKLGEGFKILGIPNFRAQMAIKLVDNGIDTLDKVFLSKSINFKKAGFGDRQAQQLFTELKEAKKRVDHPTMMWASGLFARGFAISKFSTLLEHYSLASLKRMSRKNRLAAIEELPQMSQKTALLFEDSFEDYLNFIEIIDWKPTARFKSFKDSASSPLNGKVFVFTKFRDQKLQSALEQKGAKISNSVTKATTALIVLDKRISSTKVDKAKNMGIPVIDLPTFKQRYLQ